MGGGSGMGGSGFGGDWMNLVGGQCCPTKKISGSIDPEKDGVYDLVIDGYMVANTVMNAFMNMFTMGSGYGMGPGSGDTGFGSGMGSEEEMGSDGGSGMGSGYGMNMGSGMGFGGMGMGSGMGMGFGGMGMGSGMDNMQWPEMCRRHCIYKKRNSYDERMFCFARSESSQSMCLRDENDGDGERYPYKAGAQYGRK